jgi:plastocyanin
MLRSMVRRACLIAVAVVAGCGPSLWSVGGAPRGAEPSGGGAAEAIYDEYGELDGGATVTTTTDPEGELTGPAADKAKTFIDAADLLRRAQQALDAGNTSLADLLFSSAELITGPEAVADLAPAFRTGAPPRVTEAPIAVPDAGPQQAAVGSSEEDEVTERPDPDGAVAEAPAPTGSLDGTLQIAGAAPGGTLAFVTLEPLDRKGRTRRAKQRVMEQRNREFAPRLMLVPVGSTVSFPNYDKIFHNVFSASAARPFDLGLYREGQARSITFDHEGFVRIGCNLHANMAATIVVIGAPHYVFTGADGAFRFRTLVPGRYKLRAWSEKSRDPITQDVTIKPGKNTVAVGVASDAAAGPLPDKFGKPRGKK